MQEQINIIQFTPYYPPHIGWVEKVVYDIHENWNDWESLVVTSNIWIENIDVWENIIVYPAFNIVNNFPFPKFWKPDFWKAIKKLQKNITSDTRIITHTRFFFSSIVGWIFARKNKLKWTHIEHGSAFVNSGNTLIDICSKVYDITLWKYCIKKSDTVLAISTAAKVFLELTYKRVDIDIWYRGIDIMKNIIEKQWDICFVFVGRLTKLKNVSSLLESYKKWNFTQKLYIFWDGDEKQNLENQSKWKNIEFLWATDNQKIIDFLQKNKCIVINSSIQEWLPTIVIEWLITKNLVIATNVWGTSEISSYKDLLIYEAPDIESLITHMKQWLKNYDSYSWESYNYINVKFSMKNSINNLYNYIK